MWFAAVRGTTNRRGRVCRTATTGGTSRTGTTGSASASSVYPHYAQSCCVYGLSKRSRGVSMSGFPCLAGMGKQNSFVRMTDPSASRATERSGIFFVLLTLQFILILTKKIAPALRADKEKKVKEKKVKVKKGKKKRKKSYSLTTRKPSLPFQVVTSHQTKRYDTRAPAGT